MGPRSCNLLVLLCSPPPEAAGLIERWDGFVKTQSQHQGDGSNQEGWSRALQVVYSLNQHTLSPMVSPIFRISGPGIKGWKRKYFHSLPISDPLGRFLLPVPTTLSSSGLEILVPRGSSSSRSHNKHPIDLGPQT